MGSEPDCATLAAAKDRASAEIERIKEQILELSHTIHANPELSWEEYEAAALVAATMRDAGFQVTEQAYGVETAVEAVYGDGDFTVVVCAEYDALPGVGHACGHNIICAAGVGAALGLATVASEAGLRVVLLGTPAEEHGGGKVSLLEAGVTKSLSLERGVYVSALELFSVGIGPSSSHTVGPMRAGLDFRRRLGEAGLLDRVTRFHCRLEGSLAATGVGHGTPDAAIAGLRGYAPETVDPALVHGQWAELFGGAVLDIGGVPLRKADIEFAPLSRPHGHPNSMVLTALAGDAVLAQEAYLSVGGGFIVRVGESEDAGDAAPKARPAHVYHSMAELLRLAEHRRIRDIAWDDEVAFHGAERAGAGLDAIWTAMRDCVERGLETEGVLPGGLHVRRRAAGGWRALMAEGVSRQSGEALAMYAMAINEENAGGGRVVTAPTNGAAGVLPAVLYYATVERGFPRDDIHTFLLTATAVGSIFKANASISGAEAGCQAEVGSACAMAAAGLTAVRGGTPAQIENAAEIAIEHHLGLTCDPVGGLVQIPCIERNAVAASTALMATRLALLGDGSHIVPLDTAIETMRQTGADMSERYKETSQAGLAVNVVEC